MRKIKLRHILSFTMLAILLVACTQDELADSNISADGEQPLVLTANIGLMTRSTADNYWDGGETVYVQVINDYEPTQTIQWDTAAVLKYKVAADKVTLEYSEGKYKPFWTFTKKPKLIRAWYSGKVVNYETGYDTPYYITDLTTPVTWYVMSNQDVTYDNYYTKMSAYEGSDFIFAQQQANPSKAPVNLTFYHQVAKVIVNVRKSSGLSSMETRNAVSIQSSLTGSFTPPEIDSEYGSWKSSRTSILYMKPLASPNTIDFGDGDETALASYEALVIPQTIAPTSSWMGLSPTGYDGVYLYKLEKAITWKPGCVYTYNMMLTLSGLELSSSSISIGWDTTGENDSGEIIL